ncbi:MAG TPA: serine hydrolase domain-containing protein [Chloroflexota bacterium]|jgi:CubicO group peptidase (beta-lactamase class C family)
MKTTGLPHRISRRRILALAGGTAAALAAAPGHLAAKQGPAEPTPAGPAAPELPLPSTLAADASPEFRAVAEALVAAMRESRIPGAALGILAGDREEHATFGVASLSSLRPVTPATLFQIGSLAKTYTATVIWRLIDEGALALDAPVRTYLPTLRLSDEATAATVTVANLLDHTAGWYGDEGFETGNDDDALARYVAERLPVLPQLFPCGAFFSYNNSAFQLLGRLIEVTTGTPYNDAMQRLLLGPLDLTDTLLEREAVLRRPYADGHFAGPINGRDGVAVQTPLWVPRAVDPAGGIWATTPDVLRYARLHLGAHAAPERARVVQPASLRRMQEPVVPVPGTPLRMGLDWFSQEVDGLRAISHNGDTNGQHTVFLAVPERGFAVTLLLNGQPGGAAGLVVLDEALARYPGLGSLAGQVGITRAGLAPEDAEPVALTREQLAPYAGRYVDPGQTDTFSLTADGLEATSELTPEPGAWEATIAPLPPTGPVSIAFLAEDSAVAGGGRLAFVRNGTGDVGWVASGLRLRPRIAGF